MVAEEIDPGGPAGMILRMFLVSGQGKVCFDAQAMAQLHLGEEEADVALDELRASGLLEPGPVDAVDIELTDAGGGALRRLWPAGQLPDTSVARTVMGHFSGEWDFPVYLADPATEATDVVPPKSPFAREASSQGWRWSAWTLRDPGTGLEADRVLVRLDEGHGTVTEFADDAEIGTKIGVSSGCWLSVDCAGRCRERRGELEPLLFLIAMGAG